MCVCGLVAIIFILVWYYLSITEDFKFKKERFRHRKDLTYMEKLGVIAGERVQPVNWKDKYNYICDEYKYVPHIVYDVYGKAVDTANQRGWSGGDQSYLCPDSTFSYVTNLKSRIGIPDAADSGCVQIKNDPYCYLSQEGKYKPNFNLINSEY